jgi:hypothetical protein
MSNKLEEFISHVKTGMAKTTHFEVLVARPSSLMIEPLNSNIRKIFLFCEQAQLPGMSYETNQVRSYGEVKEVVYSKLYEHINLSFYVDAGFLVKDFFNSWMNVIQDPKTRDFNYPTTYLAPTVEIIVQDAQDMGRYKCTLYNAFPKSISAVQLDSNNKDIMKLQVSLSYQYAENEVMSNYNQTSDTTIVPISPALPSYDYGYDSFSTIPENYFNNFVSFQDEFDFTTGGVQSPISIEAANQFTGFGGVFS